MKRFSKPPHSSSGASGFSGKNVLKDFCKKVKDSKQNLSQFLRNYDPYTGRILTKFELIEIFNNSRVSAAESDIISIMNEVGLSGVDQVSFPKFAQFCSNSGFVDVGSIPQISILQNKMKSKIVDFLIGKLLEYAQQRNENYYQYFNFIDLEQKGIFKNNSH
jgi:hypothetical protein